MPFFRDFFLQLNELLAQQSLVRKLIAGVVLLGVLGGLGYLLCEHGSSMTQEVLFADLNEEQAKPVQDELKRLAVPYKIAQSEKGYTIRVAQEKVLELRLQLASKVSKSGAGTGWSLFDVKEFGMTTEEMGIKKYRAVKGELERTIAALEMVKTAKVELAMPEPELFVKDRTPPKASVLLVLFPQMPINEEQVRTIQMLVSGSVDGLTPDNVVVGDNFGNTLSTDASSDRMKEKKKLENQERLIAMNEKLRQQTGQEYEKNIVDALTPLFGAKGVKAKVNVEYDHTAREENSKKYDPVAVAVSTSESEKMSAGKGGKLAVGVVGTARHVENNDHATSGTQDASEYSKENIRNNNVGFTESRTTFGAYQIKRITASVVVDNKPVVGADGKVTKTPLAKKELTDIEETVKGIINFNEKRGAGSGDEVKVTNIAFFSPADSVSDMSVLKEFEDKKKMRMYIQYGIYAAVLIGFLFFVIRPLMRIMAPQPAPMGVEGSGPAAALAEAEKRLLATVGGDSQGALPGRLGLSSDSSGEIPSGETLKLQSSELDDEIMEFAKTNPKKVALVLRSWMDAANT